MTSRPSNQTSPALGSIRRRMQRPVVVLPQPDSPTRPSVSPARDVEADAVDRVHLADARARADRRSIGKCLTQVADAQSRRLGHGTPLLSTACTRPRGRARPRLQRRHACARRRPSRSCSAAAKRQPGGGSSRLGTVPGIASSRVLVLGGAVDARHRAEQALRVGMRGLREQRLDRRLLDHLAGIHHHDALRRSRRPRRGRA